MISRRVTRGSGVRRGGQPRLTFIVTAVFSLILVMQAHASPAWELRVCSDPARLPFSSIDQAGFENEIAEIIADELGVNLKYEWVPFTDPTVVQRQYLWAGKCDVVFGLEDGQEGYLHSLTYFRSPYTFVQRTDSLNRVSEFDDLADSRIALQESGTPPHVALVNRGLTRNISQLDVYGHYGNSDWLSRIVDVVAAGEVDVSIAWGPIAGYFAGSSDLMVTPVLPEIEPPFLLMLKSSTIGVRPGDDALRDMIDRALASRWDDIQAVLESFRVPLANLPDPRAPLQPVHPNVLKIGVLLPQSSENAMSAETYHAALSARRAVELAAAEAVGLTRETIQEVIVLFAVAPDETTARNAANRLIAADGVHALVGGLVDGHTSVLSERAVAADLTFINIGSQHGNHGTNTLHVSPTSAQYLAALSSVGVNATSWLTVYEDDADGRLLVDRAQDYFNGEAAAVTPGQRIFTDLFDGLSQNRHDGVLVLLHGDVQTTFLNQLGMSDQDVPVLVLPDLVSQTRASYESVRDTVPELAGWPRIALWDASLPNSLNETYTGRFGAPLEPAGWAAYAAITALTSAFVEGGSNQLHAQLASGLTFDAGKTGMRFDRCTGVLMQDLYVVELQEEDAGRSSPDRLLASRQVAMAEVIDVLAPSQRANGACE